MVSLPNLIAQCTVMDSLISFTITLENVLCVCYVCVCVNTAHNESNSQTYVNYAHLNHFQNKLDYKLFEEDNLDTGN
jgi:hypothetical protein